ncbi:Macrolide export ATP-binding/permease protein MacB [Luteitalea pratensis]|uniref:Macrolide export ATP-binding/permease protein MacB n=1 Tax=Luteitalea pratensis TaxID=1855912 RepID=A0A143PSE5_LUTPR|nr:ADOP family duplicated permease [Luteitalea pratensis]AMY11311.1 Macrolide export ATP-binding/permease protein MacB [Luteitalea pratensis]
MRRTLRKIFRRRRLERELEAEIAFHRDMAASHGNATPFGNTLVVQEQVRDLWHFTAIENVWRDLRYATRGLRRSPGLVLSALLSLGFGIGVNVAIFSLVMSVLLGTPSIVSPDEWVGLRLGGSSHAPRDVVEQLRRSGAFREVVGEREESSVNWDTGTDTRPLYGVDTTTNYFAGLGIPMLHGRGYNADDPHDVVVLSHRFWRDALGSDPAIVGRSLRLDGRMYTITGVLPARHRTLIGMGFSPDVFVPQFRPDAGLQIYVRVEPGTSADTARSRAEAIAVQLDRTHPGEEYARNVVATPVAGRARLAATNSRMLVLFSAVLLAVVGLVLLLACVNVAGLLLARAAGRSEEMAVRLALGASRGRLLQQLLAESLVLAVLGLACGFFLRQLLAWGAERITLPLPVPVRLQLDLDSRVLVYSVVLMFLASLAAGVLPAWQATRESLAVSGRRGGRLRLRRGLVVAQVAVAFVVLTTSVLFLRNLFEAGRISPGFDTLQTIRADVHLPSARYDDPQRSRAFVASALQAMDAAPGIGASAAAYLVPLTDGSNYRRPIIFADSGERVEVAVHWNAVSPRYFQVMAIPFVSGSTFAPREDSAATPVIVNREWTRRYSPQRPAVGRSFRHDGNATTLYRVVGVVEGTKNRTLGEEPLPQLYEHLALKGVERSRVQLIAQVTGPPALAVPAVVAALRGVEPAAGVTVEPMAASMAFAMLPSQVGATMLGSLGLLGLGLAAVGLYGVIAYSVTRRRREIGIRMAVGAGRSNIVRLVLGEAVWLVGLGAVIGLGAALLLTRPLAAFLVPGVSPADPVSYAAVLLALTLTAVLASAAPVLRAIHVAPTQALKAE